MRTRFELVLPGEDETFLRAVGEEALAEIEACEKRYSLFDRASLLSRINGNAGNDWLALDREAFELLCACASYHRETKGTFDITVAPLMRAMGFHGKRGSRAEIDKTRSITGMRLVEFDPDRQAVRFREPGVKLDLGGVAKGFALDLAASVLREHGIDSALIHGGTSTIIAIGAPPGEDAWRIALGPGEGDPVVALRDGALSVSAPHGRMMRTGGERLGHVLDPRTGEPTQAAALAAVLCESAARADAWSTGLLVSADANLASDRGLTAIVKTNADPPLWRCAGRDQELFMFRSAHTGARAN